MIALSSASPQYIFLLDAASHLNCLSDPEKAERVYRTILHRLRDILQLDDAIGVLRLLPQPLKPIYIENWHTQEIAAPISSLQHFIEAIRRDAGKMAYYDFPSEDLTMHAVKVVLEHIENDISSNKKRLLESILPDFLKQLITSEDIQVHPFRRIYKLNKAI